MRWLIPLVLSFSCGGGEAERSTDRGEGLLGDGWNNPFPSTHLIVDGKVSLDADTLPSAATPLDTERLSWRTGFSLVQPSVLRADGLRAQDLPGSDTPPSEGTVFVADLDAGRLLVRMAELDAHEDAVNPVLIVRPLEAAETGHRLAVAVLDDVMPRSERFDSLVDGNPSDSLVGHVAHYQSLLDALEALGVPRERVALAWDFPVASGTEPLRSALAQVEPSGGYTFDRVRDLDDDDRLPPRTWRSLEGWYSATDFLVDDRTLQIDAQGEVRPTGTVDVPLFVHVPESLRDAAPHSAPVLFFGHGIFSEPGNYLDEEDDPSAVLQLADEGGFVVVATDWRGLCWSDRVEAIEAAQDIASITVVTDRLVQAHTNLQTLVGLVRDGGLLEDELLSGAHGEPIADASALYYYGISLGAIEGAVFLAQEPPIRAGALHVGGSMWSTMLERSSNWVAFELFVEPTVPDPADRQLVYALSQLYWDPIDPMAWTPELRDTPLLLQASIGDEQVPNMTTDALARSIGLPLIDPMASTPQGVEVLSAPLGPGARGLVQFDPEVPLPDGVNRPAETHGAHHAPRRWAGARLQVLDYLRSGQEGQIVHHCGEAVCSASNTGDP